MQDVHQAVSALGEAIGMDEVAFDGNGNLTLIFDGTMAVNFHEVDEGSFELWADLPDLGGAGDARLLASVLAANHLGEGTGAARLALRPDRSGFVLCQRVAVAGADATALADTVAAFVRLAAFWSSNDARDVLGGRGATLMETPGSDFRMIRI